MVPLEKTVSFKADDSRDKVLEVSEKLGIDRFPIFGENTEPLGLINVYDILFDTDSSNPARQYMTASRHLRTKVNTARSG